MTRIEIKLSAVRPQKQHHSPKPPGRMNPAQPEHRKLFTTDILVEISLCIFTQVNVKLPITKHMQEYCKQLVTDPLGWEGSSHSSVALANTIYLSFPSRRGTEFGASTLHLDLQNL